MNLRFTVVLCLAAAPGATAQGNRVELLGRAHPKDAYNDVWGYRAPDGREYALLLSTVGTSVINATDPTRPVEVAFFPGPVSTWRDARTYGAHAYVVTEAGGGMQIIDLTNPDRPTLVTTWGQSVWSHAHNIAIDTATGWVYLAGSGRGTWVVDVSQDPVNPTVVGNFVPRIGTFHDLQVENGLGHGAAMNSGSYFLFDVRSWPFTELANPTTPGRFTHSAWPNASRTLAVTTDEVTGGVAQVWDISDPRNPVRRGSYTANPAAVPHNVTIVGDTMHLAFYTEGYRAVDMSDPDNLLEIGHYDTWPGPTGGFRGAWGIYPFQPSGSIYVSDRATGLYVLRLTRADVRHTQAPHTTDEIGPYSVTAVVDSATPVGAVTLRWWRREGGGAEHTVPMLPTGRAREYAAAIPGQTAPATVHYRVEVQNAAGTAHFPDRFRDWSFDVGVRSSVWFDDFESGTGGWTHGQTSTEDDWQHGIPAGRTGVAQSVSWSDPSIAFSGESVFGNDLGGTGWNGRYFRGVSNWLESPPIPTGGARGLKLRFRRFLSVEDAQADQARVLVNGQTVWQNPAGRHTVDERWELVEYDIAPIADAASTLRVRFTLDANGGLQLGGWTIDDVEVLSLDDCVPPEHYGAGTAGTGGAVPVIGASGPPRIGSPGFSVTGGNMRGGASAFCLLGLGRTDATIGGVTLLVDPVVAAVAVTASGTPGTAGAGLASIPLPIPNDPSLDDVDLFVQWAVADTGSQNGVAAASDGLRLRICRD